MSALFDLFSVSAFAFTSLEHGAGLLGYIGPGAGLSMMGALAAVACVILLALIGPLLIPIRMVYSFLRKRRERIAIGDAQRHADPRAPATAQAELCCSYGGRKTPNQRETAFAPQK